MKRNLIAHYQSGTSDKIYIVSVRELPSGYFEVLAKWGRRHCTRIQLLVKGIFKTETEAIALMTSLLCEKTNKGYKDIEYPGYTGTVTRDEVRNFLEVEPEELKNPPKRKVAPVVEDSPEDVPPPRSHRNFVVRCINNLGLEHLFEVGAEYNAETTGDVEMFRINGNDVFAERFKRLS